MFLVDKEKYIKIVSTVVFTLIMLFGLSYVIQAEEITTINETTTIIETTTIENKTTAVEETTSRAPIIKSKKIYVNTKDKKYSYNNMKSDIKSLTKKYGSVLKAKVLTKTADNRNMYCITLGNPNATRTIVVETTIHGREWLNTQFIMARIEYYARNYDTAKYKGMKISQILDNVKLVIVPMVNPDGVSISQYGLKGVRNKVLKKRVKKLAEGNYKTWKSNARGVDINRNYKEGYGGFGKNSKKYSATGGVGKKALSEKESKAMVKLVNTVKPVATICYHEAGKVLYYRYYTKLVKTIYNITKYQRIKEGRKEYGTFADFLDRNKIPNCTPETCKVPAPVSHKQYSALYKENKDVLIASAKAYMK